MAHMFSVIARRYDTVNDLLSFGLHRRGRDVLMQRLGLEPGLLVLDVCAGTGQLAQRAIRLGAEVILVDGCEAMLKLAQERLGSSTRIIVADALELPFADHSFDCAMVGFALRNVISPQRLFEEMGRVVKPGGKVACLEFTQPEGLTRPLFKAYLATVVPALGRFVDAEAYRYLARSVAHVIDVHAVSQAMTQAGLERIEVIRCVFGTMAVHLGIAA